jgi:hypothetical protein
MFPNPDDDDSMSIRMSRSWRWIMAFALVCALGALPWWLRETSTNRDLTPEGTNFQAGTSQPLSNTAAVSGTAGAVGTSGIVRDVRETAVETGIIRDLATITGSLDGHELVGRRISIAVPVLESANDNAFWVGAGRNRLLVVIQRDRRDDIQRQISAVADNGIATVNNGQTATVTGTIETIPSAEEMTSWGLTSHDKSELAGRPIYIRAEKLEPAA